MYTLLLCKILGIHQWRKTEITFRNDVKMMWCVRCNDIKGFYQF
jgi:hypothetical protein